MTPCRTLAAFLLAACLVPAPALAADSPDNLDIVWARANRAQTPVYADASASSKVLVTLRKDDLVHIAGTRTVDGETWYNVVSYELTHDTDGWIRGSDTWVSS